MSASPSYGHRLENLRSWLNDLSLLVVFGTSLTFYFFSVLFGAPAPWEVIFCLGLSVWCIYTADHLRDGWIHKENSRMSRHRRHYRFRYLFLTVLILAIGLLAYVAYTRVGQEWVRFGWTMVVLILLYFLANLIFRKVTGNNLPFKELGIAFIVTLSLAYSPVFGQQLRIDDFALIASFFLVNWANLLQFSFFDHRHDVQSGFASIGAYLDEKQLSITIRVILFLQIPVLVYLFWNGELALMGYAVVGLMWFQQVIIQKYTAYFGQNERYRFWGDLIYLLPIFYLIFSV